MTGKLLDSCILIDYSRGSQQALQFVDGLSEPPLISVLTMTETLAGVRNSEEQQLFDGLFAVWRVVDVTPEIARLAGTHLKQYRKSHGTDLVDAVIAAAAGIHEAELVTLNLKHFPMFKGLKVPY